MLKTTEKTWTIYKCTLCRSSVLASGDAEAPRCLHVVLTAGVYTKCSLDDMTSVVCDLSVADVLAFIESGYAEILEYRDAVERDKKTTSAERIVAALRGTCPAGSEADKARKVQDAKHTAHVAEQYALWEAIVLQLDPGEIVAAFANLDAAKQKAEKERDELRTELHKKGDDMDVSLGDSIRGMKDLQIKR